MALVNFIFNGKKCQADDSLTILNFAQAQGVNIPTLCYDKRLDPYGSCFVCVVQVKGAKTLIPACATTLKEGMEIEIDNEIVISSRKTSLELILSNHYGDCLGPCKIACPASCDAQGYVGLIANKKYREAIQLIKDTIPLPSVIGRVCPAFCEDKCRRQYVDQPIAIKYLKRFVADIDLYSNSPYMPELKPKIGKKVAIIGGGPAGLSTAYYLIQEGVEVELFEQKDRLGGMLLYGIPAYRLPKEVLQKEIALIINLGVTVNLNKKLGVDFTINSLKNEGFDAIVLAMGAWRASKLEIVGEDAENILDGIKFLENIAEKKEVKIFGRVAIIGGGNTAFDCARTCLRLGASEVVMVYRRTREEMPANDIEKEEAEEEGVKFMFLTAPIKILKEDNKAIALICQKMKLGAPDESGRRSPVPIEGSESEERFDFIIVAIGQKADYGILGDIKDSLLDGKKINYNEKTGQTLIPYIFTAGDYATGAATVVEALGGGKKVAMSIIKYFKNENLEPKKEFLSKREDLQKLTDDFFNKWERKERETIKILRPEVRIKNFDEIESIFIEDKAISESKRCMECGCMDLYECQLKKYAEQYDVIGNRYKGEVNIIKEDFSNSYISLEPSKCILCGRCIRICSEKINLGIYGYVKRGFESLIAPSFKYSLSETDCISCGGCISACPVGAIVPYTPHNKRVPLESKSIDTNCFHCSIGCEIKVELYGDTIYEIKERDNLLCKKGRFNIPEIIIKKDSIEKYKNILNFEDATVYPSPSLSAEDYEALKIIAKNMKWDLINYYSQSSLWVAFASINSLPKMDFFNSFLSEKSLIIICGNLEETNPIAINRINEIKKEDTKIFLINKEMTKRLKRLNTILFKDLYELMNENLNNYNEIILLINPINFDKNNGDHAALTLYNYISSLNIELRTTLFSDAKNIYSFYNANINIEPKRRSIYIQTKPDVKIKKGDTLVSDLYLDANYITENSLKIGYFFQDKGTFLNSKNQYYKNNPVGFNKSITFSKIAKKIFNIKEKDLKIIKHKIIEKEKPFKFDKYEVTVFPNTFNINYSIEKR